MQNTPTGKVNANEKLEYIVARSQSSPEVTTFNEIKNFVTERHSFTGALEELRISNTMIEQSENKEMPAVSPTETQLRCPCGCYLKPAVGVNIRTREKTTMELRVVGSEILNYQGHIYSPEDIAPIWKKDCRTWLWKSSTKVER